MTRSDLPLDTVMPTFKGVVLYPACMCKQEIREHTSKPTYAGADALWAFAAPSATCMLQNNTSYLHEH